MTARKIIPKKAKRPAKAKKALSRKTVARKFKENLESAHGLKATSMYKLRFRAASYPNAEKPDAVVEMHKPKLRSIDDPHGRDLCALRDYFLFAAPMSMDTSSSVFRSTVSAINRAIDSYEPQPIQKFVETRIVREPDAYAIDKIKALEQDLVAARRDALLNQLRANDLKVANTRQNERIGELTAELALAKKAAAMKVGSLKDLKTAVNSIMKKFPK